MPVDERARHQLYQRLEAVLRAEEATILMEHLPPAGWAEVATKRDLDALEGANRREHEAFVAANRREHETLEAANRREHETLEAANRREHDQLTEAIEAVRKEVHQTRTLLFGLFGTVVAMGGVVFAAAHIG
jgi:hypothetical protein